MIASPCLPRNPLISHSGTRPIMGPTAAVRITVCLLGLLRADASLAKSLECATPADIVYPVSLRTAVRIRAATMAPPQSSRSDAVSQVPTDACGTRDRASWSAGEDSAAQSPPNVCPGLSTEHQRSIGTGAKGGLKFVYQKWPNQIFPFVNFVPSHDGHFGLEGGGVQGGYGHFNTSVPSTPASCCHRVDRGRECDGNAGPWRLDKRRLSEARPLGVAGGTGASTALWKA